MSSVQRKPFEHLPTSILPSHYALTLSPDLQNFTFKGKECINIEVTMQILYYFEITLYLITLGRWPA